MDLYHVLNRGVDKRQVVIDDGDRMRFVRSLYVSNDTAPPPNAITQRNVRGAVQTHRNLLVHLHAWCLMDNHYHLLLSPVDDDPKNLSRYMKKLNMGYARFFNEKYERSGYLWQGKYKKILIKNEPHSLFIPYYIHLNPLDYIEKSWRQGVTKNLETALQELKSYRWSSYLDYNNSKNFPSVITTDYLADVLGSEMEQTNQIKSIITDHALAQSSIQIET